MTDVLTSKSKNIELQFHKCKEMTQHRKIFDLLYYLPSKHMLADMFTKAVSEKIFRYLSPQIRGVTGSMHKAASMPFPHVFVGRLGGGGNSGPPTQRRQCAAAHDAMSMH